MALEIKLFSKMSENSETYRLISQRLKNEPRYENVW